MRQKIPDDALPRFAVHLQEEEKSRATIEKYLRDVRSFLAYLGDEPADKTTVIEYKAFLTERYAPASVNSMLAALNCFFRFLGLQSCCVRLLKIQRRIFIGEEKELTKTEYRRLIEAAGESRISYILQTICGTGIRVSELKYITVEAVQAGKAVVNCKNKMRIILLPVPVRQMLKRYIRESGIRTGPVFVTRSGHPLNRSNIWRDMKALCRRAGVASQKVFPHNLRHLFARIFYAVEKDIVRLADLLGHSSINTTRIYTMESGSRQCSCLERIQKILTT